MLTIQQVGQEILGGNPRKFYAMLGPEDGIKSKYILALTNKFGSTKEVSSVNELIAFFQMKHMFPPQPTVYVVRHDDEFIQSLTSDTSELIERLNIIGVVVCLFDNDKYQSKLDKFLPEYSVYINTVDKKFVKKYLKSDFPKLSDKMLDVASSVSSSYGHAQNIARLMSFGDAAEFEVMSQHSIETLFGVGRSSNDAEIRLGVASRNFRYLTQIVDEYPQELDKVAYVTLNTLLELEKLMVNKYAESNIRKYVADWTYEDIYNMFMHTYRELKRLRSVTQDTYSSLLYLFSLLQFKKIPAVEVFR